MTTMRWLVLLAVLGATGQAYAQDKVIRLDEQKIVGKIQKPEIQILITKQNLTPPYELELKESLTPKIVAAVEQKPF